MGRTWGRGQQGINNEIIHESRSDLFGSKNLGEETFRGPLSSLKNLEIQVCLLMVLS